MAKMLWGERPIGYGDGYGYGYGDGYGYGYGDGYGYGYGYGYGDGYGYGYGTVSNSLGLVGEARGLEIVDVGHG